MVTTTATPRVPTNGAILRWSRERLGLTVPEAAKTRNVQAERLAEWEAGSTHPTLAQLRNVAGLYRQTTAFFLRREVPFVDAATRPPDFRGQPRPGLALTREIDIAVERRNAFLAIQDTVADFGLNRSDFTDPEAAAAEVRDAMHAPLQNRSPGRTLPRR